MLKESIICTIIIIFIIIGNGITQNYTISSVNEINDMLKDLKEEVLNNQENLQTDKIEKKKEEIIKKWEEVFSKLAYYIEHEELEKFQTNLEAVKSYIEVQDYEGTIKEIDEGIFILNHVKDKYAFNLRNVF